MSSVPSGFTPPKTNWTSADAVTPNDLNIMGQAVNAIETGSRTVDPTQTPTGNSGTLRQLLDWLTNRIKAILGTTNWYDAPPLTLSGANAKFDASTGHKHTGAAGDAPKIPPSSINPQGSGSGLDADTVDGAHAGTAANNVLKLDASGLVPLANIPATLTGKSADTVDGKHASDLVQVTGSTMTGQLASTAAKPFKLTNQATEPANPVAGELALVNWQLKVYDGAIWKSFGGIILDYESGL